MEATQSTGPSLAQQWPAHCQCAPESFRTFYGSAADERRLARLEERLIDRLTCEFETVFARAVAVRRLADLRECSVRQVTMFFDLEPAIAIAALALLEASRQPIIQFPTVPPPYALANAG